MQKSIYFQKNLGQKIPSENWMNLMIQTYTWNTVHKKSFASRVPADLVIFTEEILKGIVHFCAVIYHENLLFFFALLTLHKISSFVILGTWRTNFTNSRNEVPGKTIVYDCKLLYNLSPKTVVEFLNFRPISENNEIQNDTKIKFKNIVLLQVIKITNEWMDKFLNFILTFN